MSQWRIAAVALALSVGIAAPARGQRCYDIQDLGTLGGDTDAFGINDGGSAVGYSTNTLPVQRAFLWRAGVLLDLGTLGGDFSYAQAINDRGQVVGTSTVTGGASQPAFLWQNGTMINLGTLGGAAGFALAINDRGRVVGTAQKADATEHAFLWNGSMSEIPVGGVSSTATGINELGMIVGTYQLADSSNHAFLFDRGFTIDLGTLGGTSAFAQAINDWGLVVGFSTPSPTSDFHAFVWFAGRMFDLGTLPGGDRSEARAVNNRGQIVGRSDTTLSGLGNPRATIWEDGHARELDQLIPASAGWDFLQDANGINDRGQIVGYGLHGGVSAAFLLTPACRCSP